MPLTKMSKNRSLLLCLLAYGAAAAAAAGVCRLSGEGSPVLAAALADLAATVVVFAFSLGLDNSSVYDPYWSVAPFPIGLYWMVRFSAGLTPRQIVLLALVLVWAVRLTANWLRRWRGLADEDWRYADYRRLGGELAWPEPAAPAMRARDVLHADVARNPVERHPEAHVLRAVDAIVGLVVVPGR